MKVRELILALAQLDQDTVIKIGHIRNTGPNFNTEIEPTEMVVSANKPDGTGEEYLIITQYN